MIYIFKNINANLLDIKNFSCGKTLLQLAIIFAFDTSLILFEINWNAGEKKDANIENYYYIGH